MTTKVKILLDLREKMRAEREEYLRLHELMVQVPDYHGEFNHKAFGILHCINRVTTAIENL